MSLGDAVVLLPVRDSAPTPSGHYPLAGVQLGVYWSPLSRYMCETLTPTDL